MHKIRNRTFGRVLERGLSSNSFSFANGNRGWTNFGESCDEFLCFFISEAETRASLAFLLRIIAKESLEHPWSWVSRSTSWTSTPPSSSSSTSSLIGTVCSSFNPFLCIPEIYVYAFHFDCYLTNIAQNEGFFTT